MSSQQNSLILLPGLLIGLSPGLDLIIGPPGKSQRITILFKDNSEETTNLLGLINEISNVAEYNINI